jgi:hypothetical protein
MMARRSMFLAIVCCLAVLSAGAVVVAFRADASPREGQSPGAVHERAEAATVAPRATIRSSSVDMPRAPIPGIVMYALALAALAIAGIVASDPIASIRVFRRGVLSARSPPLLHA